MASVLPGDRVLIEAALNGARSRPAPVTPAEAAEEGRRAVEAGAALIHVHGRAADGSDSSEPGWYGDFLLRFRALCPGVPVSVTTVPSPGVVANVRAWEPLPEACSVNLANEVEAWGDLLEAARARGLAVEAGARHEASVDAICADGGPFASCVLLVEADGSRAATTWRYLDLAARLRAGGFTAPVVAHGYGDATWGVLGAALACGDSVRAGFEDAFTLPDGSEARSTAEPVAALVRMALAVGRTPLTPAEAAALFAATRRKRAEGHVTAG